MVASFAQTFYSENMGTPSGTTAIAVNVFQNTTPIMYSGTADVRATLPSTGYTGASGGGNVFFTSTAGRFLLIEGINTSAYQSANLELTFGQHQGATSETPSTNLTLEVSSNGTDWTMLPYTRSSSASGWELVTVNSGIPSTSNLRIRFTQTSTIQYRIDDIKLSSIAAACTLELGLETTQCGVSTLGTNDTYSVTIPYTGGANGTYTVTTTGGTVDTTNGNNPSTTAAGNIVITGVTENTNTTITVSATINGETCVVSREVIGVSCEPVNTLPYYDGFNYTVGADLDDSQMWTSANSGDAVTVVAGNLNYTGITPVGNSVSFSGSGAEAYTPFTTTTEGTIYASFLFNVTDMANVTTDGSETVFAALAGTTPSLYNVRLFYKKVGEQYQIGLASTGTTTTNYTTTSYSVGDTVYVIIGFNYTNNTLSAWINPTLATLSASTPATLTEVLTELPEDYTFGGFVLRQDDSARTPSITVDELRIVTDIADLALSTVGFDAISGLKVYPNPATGGIVNIASDANAVKAVVIYDMVGKQVVNTVTENGTVNVSNLSAGIYIVNITEEGKTATRKLVVR